MSGRHEVKQALKLVLDTPDMIDVVGDIKIDNFISLLIKTVKQEIKEEEKPPIIDIG